MEKTNNVIKIPICFMIVNKFIINKINISKENNS